MKAIQKINSFLSLILFSIFTLLIMTFTVNSANALEDAHIQMDICTLTPSIHLQSTLPNAEKLKDDLQKSFNDFSSTLNQMIEVQSPELLSQGLPLPMEDLTAGQNSKNPFLTLESKILVKMQEFLQQLNLKASFQARLTYIPHLLCNQISQFTMSKIDQEHRSLQGVPTDAEQIFNFNNYDASRSKITKIRIMGFNFNIDYEAPKVRLDESNLFNAKVSGSLLFRLPTGFSFPIEKPVQTNRWMPNLVINRVYFEQDSKRPEQKHYMLINLDHVNFSNEGMEFLNWSKTQGQNPELHIYFTDEVSVKYMSLSRFMHFEANLTRPLRSLLGELMVEHCFQERKAHPEADPSFLCNMIGYFTMPINHLVSELNPIAIENIENDANPTLFALPVMRPPIHSRGEAGGIKIVLRKIAPFQDATQREEHPWFSFYLNGDSWVNQFFGGKSMVQSGLDDLTDMGLASLDFALVSKNLTIEQMQLLTKHCQRVQVQTADRATSSATSSSSSALSNASEVSSNSSSTILNDKATQWVEYQICQSLQKNFADDIKNILPINIE